MPVLFAVTLFVSATLLFMVQPMVGKKILPLLGGSPAAWNTCMVFFQGLLLLGYLYAHHLTTRYGDSLRRQVAIHAAVLGGAVVVLVGMAALSPDHSPVAVFRSIAPQGQAYPMFGVLALLFVAIGVPFLVVSTSAPLLQRWFAWTGHPSAADPYFLYAASNAGSLISLLGYPLLVEPSLSLASQAWVWAVGFAGLAALIYLCGKAANNPFRPSKREKQQAAARSGHGGGGGPTAAKEKVQAAAGSPVGNPAPPTWLQKLRWMALAFVPSSLMLGVTFHIATDIVSLPLLWVVPLALYLLTFIIAFGRTPPWFRPLIGNLSPVLTLLLVFCIMTGLPRITDDAGSTLMAQSAMHLVVYFATALLMHSELARERPHPNFLTGYFLWISIGGVLGGAFNALVAPVVFSQGYEYPVAIVIGCLLIPNLSPPPAADPTPAQQRRAWAFDLIVPLAMVGLMVWLTGLGGRAEWFDTSTQWVADKFSGLLNSCGLDARVGADTIGQLVVYALPCMLCFFFIDRPVRFGLCVAAVLGVHYYRAADNEAIIDSERSFFGIMKVEEYPESSDYQLLFGVTKGEGESESTKAYRLVYFRAKEKGSEEERAYGAFVPKYRFRRLYHGTTLHGIQAVTTPQFPLREEGQLLGAASGWDVLVTRCATAAYDFRQEPLTYYHRTGPVGAAFARLRSLNPKSNIGMVGLGTGSVSCYAQPGQHLTFYEIDPTVRNLVETGKYFTYVQEARDRGATVEIVMGDARLMLEPPADPSKREPHHDRKYGILLIDAFSSDSIPVHLLTKEALEVYKTRLDDHGLLAVHISNRYIELEPVVQKLAAETGLEARVWSDNNEAGYPGKTASSWILLARTLDDLGDEIHGTEADTRYGAVGGGYAWLHFNHPWRPLREFKELRPWTDDYTDVLAVMRLKPVIAVRKFLGQPVLPEKRRSGSD